MEPLDPRDQLHVLSNCQPFAVPTWLHCGGHTMLLLLGAERSKAFLLNNRRGLVTRSGISAAAADKANPFGEHAQAVYAGVWDACNTPDPMQEVRAGWSVADAFCGRQCSPIQ